MVPKLKISKGLAIQPSIHPSIHSFIYTVHSSVHASIYPFTLLLCQPFIYLYSTGTYFYLTNYTIHSGFAWQKASSVALAAHPICPSLEPHVLVQCIAVNIAILSYLKNGLTIFSFGSLTRGISNKHAVYCKQKI
jgi:hypothetical protein